LYFFTEVYTNIHVTNVSAMIIPKCVIGIPGPENHVHIQTHIWEIQVLRPDM